MKLLYVVIICAFVFLVCFLIDTLLKLIFPKSRLPAVIRVFLYLYLIRLQMYLVLKLMNFLRRLSNEL